MSYATLVDWVEKGQAPGAITVRNAAGVSHPLRDYPKVLHLEGKDAGKASS